jgi:hypothetical protein
MTSFLSARLGKMERTLPSPQRQGRVIRIVASDQDEAEARKLLEAEGYDPDSWDIAIIRLIAVLAGQTRYSEPPPLYSGLEWFAHD